MKSPTETPFGRGRSLWLALLLAALTGLAGLAAGIPLLAVFILLPLAAYLMIVHPFVGVLLIVATLPLENAFLFGGVTASRLLGIAVALGWVAGKLLRGESFLPLMFSPLVWVASAFLAFVLLSTFWAEDPLTTRSGFIQLAQMLVLAVIVLDVSRTWNRVHWLVRVLVLSAAVAATLTVAQYMAGGVRRAGEDLAGINGTAELLITLIPFAFYLLWCDRQRVWAYLGLFYIPLAIAGVSVTFSRMSFLLLPAILAAMVLETMRAKRGRARLAMLAAFVFIAVGVVVPVDRVVERASTIVPYLQRTVGSSLAAEKTASDRGYHLQVGLAIFRDHPLLGVGYNNFGSKMRDVYQFRVPGAPHFYFSERSPHSSHIGMLAELGILGSSLWFLLLIVAVTNLLRGHSRARRRGNTRGRLLIRAAIYALLLQILPYAFYAPNQKAKFFWVLIGLTVALLHLPARSSPDEAEGTDPRRYAKAHALGLQRGQLRSTQPLAQRVDR